MSKENGNLPDEMSAKGPIREADDANGNSLPTTEKDFGSETDGRNDAYLDLDKQYDRVKVMFLLMKSSTTVVHSC